MNSMDASLLIWLNGLSGNIKFLDDAMRLIASDYLMPLAFSLSMLGLWFSGKTSSQRLTYQITALIGISALSISNIVVWTINSLWNRPRPFLDHPDELNLLFYSPTDPSFPANPVAIGFAVAAAGWTVNRKFGLWLFTAASLYGFSRVYVGVFYPTDIVAGALVGIAVYRFTSYLRRALEPLVPMLVRLARGFSVG
ncbi:MAG: phosphatase PAP2 family protein [Chloroflexota bacterium]|nr:phosphatase PAP2 family protein [Chloroflexota bacterium]MQG37394.1 phosphatase PAP2 family protein [SAR202 cluster bacterium]|tara:strand:- start:4296 stop:4883 length:588 start_codon:yes stop_codon:yes gene_type:complete